MYSLDAMNNVKVLFFIFNTIVGLLAGLVMFSYGLSVAVITESAAVAYNIVGLIALGVATLGYAGAVCQIGIMLFVYAGLMVLAAIADIVAMALIEWRKHDVASFYLLTMLITHLSFVVLTFILAVNLAVKSVKARNQASRGMVLRPRSAPVA